ncbi:RHS repeat-associated core domain-containing protein, partial [Microbacterium rhizomatis]
TTTQTDALGRVVKTTDNLRNGHPVDGQVRVVESRAYPVPGTVEITDAWGAVTVTKQDVFGREVETVAPTGLAKITRYDDIAHTVSTALTPTGNIADAEYTSTSVLDAAGQTTQSSGVRADQQPVPTLQSVFDGFGREIATTDGTTRTEVQRDVFGNPATTTITSLDADDPPIVAARRFDEFGSSVEKTLTGGDESRSGGTRTLDVLGQTLSETDQNGLTSTFEYTPDGLIARAVTGYGQTTVNTYHPVTRKLTETVTTSPIGDQVRTGFEYDPVTRDVAAVFDPADRAGTQVSYTHDAFRNITSTTYPDGNRITHTYDPNGRKASTSDIDGNTTSYSYDRTGLLTTVIQTDHRGVEVGRVGYTYDEYARVTELDRGNGVTTNYTFTAMDEIATEITRGPDGAAQDARRYVYDGHGNLSRRTDTAAADRADGAERTTSTTTMYEYDAQDRLTRSTLRQGEAADGVLISDTAYVLNVSGDIFRENTTALDSETGASITTTREFTYTPTGEVVTLTSTAPDGTVTTDVPTYDAAGNLTHAVDGTRYTYNALNQPVTETTPTGATLTTEYWITGLRARLSTTDPDDEKSGDAVFYWDDATLINETHTLGGRPSGTASYLIGSARNARTTTSPGAGAETVYYTQDRHGSVTTLTGSDGTPTTRYSYTDYGTPTTTTAGAGTATDTATGWIGNVTYQPIQYAGEHTAPTGGQYLQARTYDPGTMRFTTQDTAQLHNTYNYADLNPVMKLDPTGRTPDWDAIMLGINGVLDGLGIALAAYSAGMVISTLLTGGAAALGWAGVAAAAGGIGADLYSATIATGRILAQVTPEFIGAAAAFFTSDAAAWTETALGIGVGAAGYLTYKAAKAAGKSVAKALSETPMAAPPGTFAEAAAAYVGAPEKLAAWRVSYKKNGTLKAYHHNTTSIGAADAIVKDGFKPGTRGAYGPGTYFGGDLGEGQKHGRFGLDVELHPQSAVKIDTISTQLYGVRNPFWTKSSPTTVEKHLSIVNFPRATRLAKTTPFDLTVFKKASNNTDYIVVRDGGHEAGIVTNRRHRQPGLTTTARF